MDVISLCRLPALGFVWQPRAGAFAQTVIAKATYVLEPGVCTLAPEQDALSEEDNHWNDDPARSVYAPSDKAPFKPKAEVMLVGHAFAPTAQPVRSLVARLSVGKLDKAIEVWCDRKLRLADGQPFDGPRFTKMPLRWERTSGGPGTDNPVGMRFDGPADAYGTIDVPNLQAPGSTALRPGACEPIGFAPVAGRWPRRVRKLGGFARTLLSLGPLGWEGQPLPEDFDYAYFQAAPSDQRMSELREDERITLEHLHPVHARLVTRLPGLRPRAVVDRITGEREEIRLVADTLWIDTDRSMVTLLFRGRLGLRHPQEAGRVAFWIDGAQSGVDPAGQSHAVSPTQQPSPVISADSIDKAFTRTLPLISPPAVKDPLPFAASAPNAPSHGHDLQSLWALPARMQLGGSTGTIIGGGHAGSGAILPFQPTAPSIVPSPVDVAAATTRAQPLAFPEPVRSDGLPPPAPPSAPQASRVFMDEKPVSSQPASWQVEPPPLLGPLATPEMAARASAALDSSVESKVEKDTPVVAAAMVAPAPASAGSHLPLSEYPLERCARIAASLGRRRAEAGSILKEIGLSADTWSALDEHWQGAILEETRRGKTALLGAYDAAYVAQLEAERGPITVEDYARITLAMERGAEAEKEALAMLDLPRGATLRVQRVWLRQMGDDPDRARQVNEAIDTLSGE